MPQRFAKQNPNSFESSTALSLDTQTLPAGLGCPAGAKMRMQACTYRPDPFESAKSLLFDTTNWRPFCDVTLTLKQACQSDNGAWIKIDDYPCRQAFRHFMNLLNKAVYGAAFRRHRKRLRVLPVLEKGEVRASALRSWERGTCGRWHIHCAIELPTHLDGVALEKLIRRCWGRVELGCSRILVRDGANAGWIGCMLKSHQKAKFDCFLDCIIVESWHNPTVDA
ncbi:MAG TPA: hypothetical protein VGF97_00285 [Rhizomicrobium sp.]